MNAASNSALGGGGGNDQYRLQSLMGGDSAAAFFQEDLGRRHSHATSLSHTVGPARQCLPRHHP
jgi:hypothetical protein